MPTWMVVKIKTDTRMHFNFVWTELQYFIHKQKRKNDKRTHLTYKETWKVSKEGICPWKFTWDRSTQSPFHVQTLPVINLDTPEENVSCQKQENKTLLQWHFDLGSLSTDVRVKVNVHLRNLNQSCLVGSLGTMNLFNTLGNNYKVQLLWHADSEWTKVSYHMSFTQTPKPSLEGTTWPSPPSTADVVVRQWPLLKQYKAVRPLEAHGITMTWPIPPFPFFSWQSTSTASSFS